jgi:uncharacterized protein (DUF1786 family)
MEHVLLIDIGAGTMDILWFNLASGIHYKAVVESPVRRKAHQLAALKGPLLVTGCEMGGGAVTAVFKKKAQQERIVISNSAAATLHHDLERVRAWGLEVVADDESESLASDAAFTRFVLEDLDADYLRILLTGLGMEADIDAVAICAQDHGTAPPGVSHLDYRHRMFTDILAQHPHPHRLLYAADQVPDSMNRLRSLAASAAALQAGEIYVMDSGMAAILGACQDPAAHRRRTFSVLDVATSHTVIAIIDRDVVAAFMEYHTHDMSVARLEKLLPMLADGELSHAQVLGEGGHGAFTHHVAGPTALDCIIATGPQRHRLASARLALQPGAPLGDNMMTGTAGLLDALCRHKQIDRQGVFDIGLTRPSHAAA